MKQYPRDEYSTTSEKHTAIDAASMIFLSNEDNLDSILPSAYSLVGLPTETMSREGFLGSIFGGLKKKIEQTDFNMYVKNLNKAVEKTQGIKEKFLELKKSKELLMLVACLFDKKKKKDNPWHYLND
jgi:hypothetical protein